ncbi:MAG: response regulator transcription factor [Acidimicrobiales bacterium]
MGAELRLRVLVVDDEPQIRKALEINLRARGYGVELAATGEESLLLAAERPVDLALIDLGLPGIDGIEVVRGIRGWSDLPVIVLSVRESEQDKVEALDAGADDYVTKPFGMAELLARMRAVTRRSAGRDGEAAVLVAGELVIDLAARTVSAAGQPVSLTPIEWRLLEALARHPGKLVTQRQLLQQVWGPAYERETNYLRVHFANIRRKLEPVPAQPRHVITEPGIGYRFQL